MVLKFLKMTSRVWYFLIALMVGNLSIFSHVSKVSWNIQSKDTFPGQQPHIQDIRNYKHDCRLNDARRESPHSLLTLRLDGGMGKILSMADKFYKKRNAPAEKEKKRKKEEQEDLEEIAEEYRGLPLEERMKIAMADSDDGHMDEAEVGSGHAAANVADIVADDDEEGGDQELDGSAESEGEAVEWAGGAGRSAIVGVQAGVAEHVDVGELVPAAGSMSLRTQPCTGDAWAGLFFDIEAKGPHAIEVGEETREG